MSTTTTQEQAEGIVDRFLASGFVKTATIVGNTIKDLVLIFVPFAVATYLLHTQEDRLVLALGVAIGLVGLVNTVKVVYAYNVSKISRKRK